jgi:multicomponent Na+:H+ antiporter subunit D
MSLSTHFPVLVVVTPLVGAALTPVLSHWRKRITYPFAVFVILVTTVISGFLVLRVLKEGSVSYHLGGWAPPWGIEILIDRLSTGAFVIASLALLTVIYSKRYAEKVLGESKIPIFYTLIILNVAGMIGFVITGDMFNLFVFMEILSLSAYALVAIGGEKIAEMAGFKYLLMGAISSLTVLLSIALLYSVTGTLNMRDMAVRLQGVSALTVPGVALALFTVGFAVKAAVFPLHVWLPDAHAIAPSPVSAILSGLVVKTGILGILRVLSIYGMNGGLFNLASLNFVLCWVGAISILVGAFFAFFQNDLKMMLAYSTISNIGYILLGIGLASKLGLIGGIVHIFNHALIKVTLFLCAGAIIYKTGQRNLSELRGIGRKMPLTMAAMSVGILSIVGIPPTNGFICKWYIVLGAVDSNKFFFAATLLVGALFILAYYAKIINIAYFREPKEEVTYDEAPLSMLIPIGLLAVACLVMGVFAYYPLKFIEPLAAELLLPR